MELVYYSDYNSVLKIFTYCSFFVAQGSDLTNDVSSVQNFDHTVNQLCVSISINDDYVLEGNETFLVRLIRFPNESVILGSNTDRTVIIIDNGMYVYS